MLQQIFGAIEKHIGTMDGSEIVEEDDRFESLPPYLSVGIAINGNKNSKFIVRWALDKFVPEGDVIVKLIHVRSKIVAVPTASKLMLFFNFMNSGKEKRKEKKKKKRR